jgi:hypothetical protein
MQIGLCSVSVLLAIKSDFLCGPKQRPIDVNNNPVLGKVYIYISILSFRRVLYVVCFLLGISPASEV